MSESDFNNQVFNRYLGEHKLMAATCQNCGALYVPPRPLCPACFGQEMVWTELSGMGTLMAYSTIYIGLSAMIAAGYDRQKPYCSGIVRLEEGPSISAQILDVDVAKRETIAIGTALQATFVERGQGEEKRHYLAFRPLEET